MSQTPHNGRDPFLDALRGLALFGILTVNMNGFKLPFLTQATGENHFDGMLNLIAAKFIVVFFGGKFFPIFSILFGIGLTILFRKTIAGGDCFKKFIRRRMAILLVIGGLHATLLWAGDILVPYAAFGFLSASFISWKSKTLLYLAATIFILSISLAVVGSFFFYDDGATPAELSQAAENLIRIYQHGSVTEIVGARLSEWGTSLLIGLLVWFPHTLAYIFLGIVVGRQGRVEGVIPWLAKARKPAIAALFSGILLSLFHIAYDYRILPISDFTYALYTLTYMIAPFFLVFAYVTIFSWIFSSGKPKLLLSALERIGRLSLSNYLFQSLLASLIFMPWGLGLYGKVDAVGGLLLTLAIFAMQIAVTDFWLRFHPVGPVEAIWRGLSQPRAVAT